MQRGRTHTDFSPCERQAVLCKIRVFTFWTSMNSILDSLPYSVNIKVCLPTQASSRKIYKFISALHSFKSTYLQYTVLTKRWCSATPVQPLCFLWHNRRQLGLDQLKETTLKEPEVELLHYRGKKGKC